MSPTTTVVIVSYNSLSTIDRTLTAARPSAEAKESVWVLVDNKPDDGTSAHVALHYPFVKRPPSQGNVGFGRGCNLGAEWAQTPYLLFLNPDAAIERDSLTRLVSFMDAHPNAGICAPAIAKHKAGMLLTPLMAVARAYGVDLNSAQRDVTPDDSPPFQTNWVCGAALMIRTDLFRRLSGFDPRFFMYFEETDLCVRAAQEGAELWVVPEAVATHEAGVSSKSTDQANSGGNLSQHFYQSRNYYLRKHHGTPLAVATVLAELPPTLARELAKRLGLRRGASGLEDRLAGGLFRLPNSPE